MNPVISIYIENLSVLAKLERNERIHTTEYKYDILKPDTLHIGGFARWLIGYDRKKNMDVISHDYETIFLITDLMLSSKDIKKREENDTENNKNLDTLCEIHKALLNSIDGLDNMCGTYVEDLIIRDRIKDLVSRIVEYVKVLKNRLTEYGCIVSADVRPLKYA
jgi:hypothetical protein